MHPKGTLLRTKEVVSFKTPRRHITWARHRRVYVLNTDADQEANGFVMIALVNYRAGYAFKLAEVADKFEGSL